MQEMDVNFSGDEELTRALKQLPGLLAERVQGDGLLAAARLVAEDAATRVRVKSGALRASIRAGRRSVTIQTLTGQKRVSGGAARVFAGGKGAQHAVLEEYGTAHSSPNPFLSEAFLANPSAQLAAARQAMAVKFSQLDNEIRRGKINRTTARIAGA